MNRQTRSKSITNSSAPPGALTTATPAEVATSGYADRAPAASKGKNPLSGLHFNKGANTYTGSTVKGKSATATASRPRTPSSDSSTASSRSSNPFAPLAPLEEHTLDEQITADLLGVDVAVFNQENGTESTSTDMRSIFAETSASAARSIFAIEPQSSPHHNVFTELRTTLAKRAQAASSSPGADALSPPAPAGVPWSAMIVSATPVDQSAASTESPFLSPISNSSVPTVNANPVPSTSPSLASPSMKGANPTSGEPSAAAATDKTPIIDSTGTQSSSLAGNVSAQSNGVESPAPNPILVAPTVPPSSSNGDVSSAPASAVPAPSVPPAVTTTAVPPPTTNLPSFAAIAAAPAPSGPATRSKARAIAAQSAIVAPAPSAGAPGPTQAATPASTVGAALPVAIGNTTPAVVPAAGPAHPNAPGVAPPPAAAAAPPAAPPTAAAAAPLTAAAAAFFGAAVAPPVAPGAAIPGTAVAPPAGAAIPGTGAAPAVAIVPAAGAALPAAAAGPVNGILAPLHVPVGAAPAGAQGAQGGLAATIWTPAPPGGFPPIYGWDEDTVRQNINPAHLEMWDASADAKIWVYEWNGTKYTRESTSLENIKSSIARIFGTPAPLVGAPAPAQASSPGPIVYLVKNLPPQHLQRLIDRRCWSINGGSTFFTLPYNPPPHPFVMTLDQLTFEDTPENAVAVATLVAITIQGNHDAQTFLTLVHDNFPAGSDPMAFFISSIRVVAVSLANSGGTGRHTAWNVTAQPPSLDPASNRAWISIVTGLKYISEMHFVGSAMIPPPFCGGCKSLGHNDLCPYPSIPGWNAPAASNANQPQSFSAPDYQRGGNKRGRGGNNGSGGNRGNAGGNNKRRRGFNS
ncbi:hypothetical protein B0H11DRAFT_2220036 [Mycena galericulata]|nr:hypothetical protein B0H11DRAFT_2220036 [Mycena galericulata]